MFFLKTYNLAQNFRSTTFSGLVVALLAVLPSLDDGLVQAGVAGAGPRAVVCLHLHQSVLQGDGAGETPPHRSWPGSSAAADPGSRRHEHKLPQVFITVYNALVLGCVVSLEGFRFKKIKKVEKFWLLFYYYFCLFLFFLCCV